MFIRFILLDYILFKKNFLVKNLRLRCDSVTTGVKNLALIISEFHYRELPNR